MREEKEKVGPGRESRKRFHCGRTGPKGVRGSAGATSTTSNDAGSEKQKYEAARFCANVDGATFRGKPGGHTFKL